jgi:hypothetical protein
MQILPQPPITDEATAERVIDQFLAGHEPLLYAADFGLTPDQVLDQIRWTLRAYITEALTSARKLSRKGTGRKPLGDAPMSSTERAKRTRKRKQAERQNRQS